MSTIDLQRAYKNLRSDVLDWPLLCLKWGGKYNCDISMPFGSRASSMHMQRVAQAIVSILAKEGIHGYTYLDDPILISNSEKEGWAHYKRAQQLLGEMGLPEAKDKTQEPANRVRWLGIDISAEDMSLSIPADKLKEVLKKVSKGKKKKTINKKELQSIIGCLVFVAKCVPPAHLFISHLLDALRAMRGKYTRVDQEMLKDFIWFEEFCTGISLIPSTTPTTTYSVDACGTRIGAEDGSRAYAASRTGCPNT